MKRIQKLLIANRGEIAIRVMRTCQNLGIETVAIYSDEDKDALFVEIADYAINLQGDTIQTTYLDIDQIISIAKEQKADAIHPGYGFLSENAKFSKACKDAGIIFVGPPEEAINLMGDKVASRRFAEENGIPLLKGITGSHEELIAQIDSLVCPVIIKASAGGGGKGMRIVENQSELKDALEATSREAKSYFGNDEVFIERYIRNPRHIEVQILGDQHGNIIHLYERECSIQRRHQKIIEEAPSISLSAQQRQEITAAAVHLAKAAKYYSAGTVEFIVDEDLTFYFMEMNTRIQVEHPVTENITGIDLIEQQILIAEGDELQFEQNDIQIDGHSIECRIYAEDPANDFRPSPGEIIYYNQPVPTLVRVDASLNKAQVISGSYDPMISKVISWGEDRETARQTISEALNDYVIEGIPTNIHYLQAILNDGLFQENKITTNYCKRHTSNLLERREINKLASSDLSIIVAALAFDLTKEFNGLSLNIWEHIGYYRIRPLIPVEFDGEKYEVEANRLRHGWQFIINEKAYEVLGITKQNNELNCSINGDFIEVKVHEIKNNWLAVIKNGFRYNVTRLDVLDDTKNFALAALEEMSGDSVSSPIPGTVVKVVSSQGAEVKKGDALIIVEAMKMENTLTAPRDGKVKYIHYAEGDKVEAGKLLIELEEEKE